MKPRRRQLTGVEAHQPFTQMHPKAWGQSQFLGGGSRRYWGPARHWGLLSPGKRPNMRGQRVF
jgi:hypothetical protein